MATKKENENAESLTAKIRNGTPITIEDLMAGEDKGWTLRSAIKNGFHFIKKVMNHN